MRGPLGVLQFRTTVGLAAVVIAAVVPGERAGAFPGEHVPPHRHDIVATFSTGVVRIDVDAEHIAPAIVSGSLALSTNDLPCPSATHACAYSLDELRVEVAPFVVAGSHFSEVHARNLVSAVGLRDDGSGISLRPAIAFEVAGKIEGHDFGVSSLTSAASTLELSDLVVQPAAGHATVFALLEGSVGSHHVRVVISTHADEPFLNRPPFAGAPPPVSVTTACVAEVVLGPTTTVDTDGDLESEWYEVGGSSIGAPGVPIVMPVGQHDVTLVSEDTKGGLDVDRTVVTVVDDGTTSPLAGASVVSFVVPGGTLPDSFAVVATRALTLGPSAVVRRRDGGMPAAVGSLGPMDLGVDVEVGDAWCGTDATLHTRARVAGALHIGGVATLDHSATVDGGVHSETGLSPGATTSFLLPVPLVGHDVTVAPGGPSVVPNSISVAGVGGEENAASVANDILMVAVSPSSTAGRVLFFPGGQLNPPPSVVTTLTTPGPVAGFDSFAIGPDLWGAVVFVDGASGVTHVEMFEPSAVSRTFDCAGAPHCTDTQVDGAGAPAALVLASPTTSGMLTCVTDADCHGSHCSGGRCAPFACGSGFFDCPVGSACGADFQCHATCMVETDCPQFQSCDTSSGSGLCAIRECATDVDCPFGSTCNGVTCDLPPLQTGGSAAAVWVLFTRRAL